DVLLDRHLSWVRCRAARLARRRRLDCNDALDARQEAVLATIDAITAYTPSGQQGGKPCSFRSFLRRMVRAHLASFLSTLQRAAGRQERRVAHPRTGRAGADGGGDSLS